TVGRGEARASRGQHHARAGGHRRAQRVGHRLPVVHDDRVGHDEAEPAQEVGDHRARLVGVDAVGGPVGGHHHTTGQAHRTHSPDLPPVFVSTRTSVITAALSTALTMSTTVRPATATAVSASISTPVRSVVETVAVIATASSSTLRSTFTPE